MFGKKKTNDSVLSEIEKKMQEIYSLASSMTAEQTSGKRGAGGNRHAEFNKWMNSPCKNGCSLCKNCEEKFRKILS
jgi:hypothetical protein